MSSIKERWAVRVCPKCQIRNYLYIGNGFAESGEEDKYKFAGFTESDLECYNCKCNEVEVDYDKWTASDIAEIFGNELEDRNRHTLSHMPTILSEVLKEVNLPNGDISAFIMRRFMERMLTELLPR